MFAAFAYAVARRTLQGAWTSRAAVLFYVWLMVFTAANIVNRCAPGWCETIGFPFAWRSWSDAIFELDGAWMGVLDRATETVAAALNLVTFAVVAGLLTRGRSQT